MKYSKLMIASDGERTGVLLDGKLYGSGIERVTFDSSPIDGFPKPQISLQNIDVSAFKTGNESDFDALLSELSGDELSAKR